MSEFTPQYHRFAWRDSLERVSPMLNDGFHPRCPDRLGHTKVEVETIRQAAALGHIGPRTPGPAQAALAFQRTKRFPQGGPRDAQLGSEERLRGKAHSGREDALVDPLA